MPYRTLDPQRILKTVQRLDRRVTERFPERGITDVCGELVQLASGVAERVRKVSQPIWWLRTSTGLLLVASFVALVWASQLAPDGELETEAFHAFQGIEAIINIMIATGAGIWFLLNLESRIKRRRVLEDLHELRSIAHVIDMHQLTKDPIAAVRGGPSTPSSPRREMSDFELSRYLDYCSEMLSLTGKLAAVYMRDLRDPIVINTVNEIEELTTNLSRKIWQKITLIRGS